MIRKPWNLPKAVIKEIFEHILKWQEFNGLEGSFQFKSVKMGNNIVPACYPALRVNADADAEDNIDAAAHHQSTHRSQMKKLPVLPLDISSSMTHLTDGHNTAQSTEGHANNVFGTNGRSTAIHDHYDCAGLHKGCCNDTTFVVIN